MHPAAHAPAGVVRRSPSLFNMPSRIITILRESFSTLPGAAASTDAFLLRWVLLGIFVPAALLLSKAAGLEGLLNDQQLIILGGHPFYLSAQDAQVSLLSTGGTFGLSVFIALYLGAVLLQQPRLGRRNHLCLLAAVAVVLAGLLSVLWHGVLYVAQPLVCVLLLWLLLVPAVLIRRLFR